MDLDWQNAPLFSVGQELATLITSCGILDKAWEEINNVSKRNAEFFLKEDEGVAYVTFPSFSSSTEDFIVTNSRYGEYNIEKETIFSVCLKGEDDKPALVHKGALNRFQDIVKKSNFRAKVEGSKAQTIIFVGHSMGGAVATLASLFYLKKKATNKSYFCITFGSPLVGNAILGESIGREDWTGKFCHVVSKYDIVPRMFLAPFDSIAKPLNEIMPHWRSKMGTDCDAVSHPSIQKNCETLLKEVQQCTSNIANKCPRESGLTSPYIPFGTYMFCSSQGAACMDDSEAVLKMLHFTMQGMPFDQLARTCASDHTDYGQMLTSMTNDLLNATPIANSATDSFEMGIALELEAMAVGPQEHSHAYSSLKKAGMMKTDQDTNIEKLNNHLSEMQSYMAEVEWYKALCENSGYYDSFKKKEWEKRDHPVNLAREKLGTFWEDIVEKEKKHVLPSNFRCQNKWINAGTAYRKLIEPLDIAYYYRTRKDTNKKSYLEVRPPRHRVLQKWMEEKEQTRTAKEKKPRTKFASLTLDSCFWAHLEHACQQLTTLPRDQVKGGRGDFHQYIWDMIRTKNISVEVFLKDSSFMIWWEQYGSFTSNSDLLDFMENQRWK